MIRHFTENNRGGSMEEAPFHRFYEFIAPGADRFEILQTLLKETGLRFSVEHIARNRHLSVFPRRPSQARPSTALVAHYDRAAGSPGANDNSAAVFQLIAAAMKLEEGENTAWRIIFTDKEELEAGEGIRDQGSYALAKSLRDRGDGGMRFFIFDACGAGDTLVISTAADRLLKNEGGLGIGRTLSAVQHLRDHALETARRLFLQKVLLLPTPLSDDAGFLRAGIAAQTITVLPSAEAAAFASLLRRKGDLAEALLSREVLSRHDLSEIPATWRSLNGPADSPLLLTPRYYQQVIHFACALCG